MPLLNIYTSMHPSDHLRNFQNGVKRARRLLARQVGFSRSAALPITELEAIYELSFLNIFVSFENELTQLFKTNMMMERDTNGRIRSIFTPKSRSLAEKMIMGRNGYFQLLPVENMERIARIYLKNGGPFVSLSSVQKTGVAQASAIRNHIAHRSEESKATYKRKVLANVTLPRTSYSPGYYLRNNLSMQTTYFDHHVAAIGLCLKQITDAT